jgi:hypothetical protein
LSHFGIPWYTDASTLVYLLISTLSQRTIQQILMTRLDYVHPRENGARFLFPRGGDLSQGADNVAAGIFSHAGVDLEFIVGPQADYVLEYMHLNGPLGYAPPGTNETQIDGVAVSQARPKGNTLDISIALGRVQAHELGHQVLEEGHSSEGIMRPGVDSGPELFYIDIGGAFEFTQPQAAKIRKKWAELERRRQQLGKKRQTGPH